MKIKESILLYSILSVISFILLLLGTNILIIDEFRLSLDGLVTGLLALTGFIFTARTFVTFKLNEVIYSNPVYRRRVEGFQRDGAYNKKLYTPLKELDKSLGNATLMCLLSLAFLAILACIPKQASNMIPAIFKDRYLVEWMFTMQGWEDLFATGIAFKILFLKIYSSLSLSFLFITVIKLIFVLSSINKNIQDIIHEWENEYENEKSSSPP